jgi:hypothetical protein
MNIDRFGRTPDEVEDEAKHTFAEGVVTLSAVANRLNTIATEGKPINRWDLKRLHDQLYEVYEQLGSATVFGMGQDPATDAEEAALDSYCDTYSDGTPVAIVIGPSNSSAWSAPLDPHGSRVPWNPKMTGPFGYLPDGPRPLGCEVIVVNPPNRRMSKVQPARQERHTTTFEDLKTLLKQKAEAPRPAAAAPHKQFT